MAEHVTCFKSNKIDEILTKNIEREDKLTTINVWRIFACPNNPLSPKHADKHVLLKIKLTSMEVSMF